MRKLATCQQLADFFTSQVLKGHGQYAVKVGNATLVKPKHDEVHDHENKLVFVSLLVGDVDAHQ